MRYSLLFYNNIGWKNKLVNTQEYFESRGKKTRINNNRLWLDSICFKFDDERIEINSVQDNSQKISCLIDDYIEKVFAKQKIYIIRNGESKFYTELSTLDKASITIQYS